MPWCHTCGTVNYYRTVENGSWDLTVHADSKYGHKNFYNSDFFPLFFSFSPFFKKFFWKIINISTALQVCMKRNYMYLYHQPAAIEDAAYRCLFPCSASLYFGSPRLCVVYVLHCFKYLPNLVVHNRVFLSACNACFGNKMEWSVDCIWSGEGLCRGCRRSLDEIVHQMAEK